MDHLLLLMYTGCYFWILFCFTGLFVLSYKYFAYLIIHNIFKYLVNHYYLFLDYSLMMAVIFNINFKIIFSN